VEEEEEACGLQTSFIGMTGSCGGERRRTNKAVVEQKVKPLLKSA
jgi:hypothetical protein